MYPFQCMECGGKFKTARAAERAANRGCPGCGGVDIDLAVDSAEPAPEHVQRAGPSPSVNTEQEHHHDR